MSLARTLRITAAAVLLSGLIASAQSPYKVLDHWKIGGDGFWDYLTVDSSAHRLYLSHGAKVEVIDTTTGKPAGAVTGLKGVHGIALDPDGKLGYISDGGANAVIVFDRATLATVATIPVGKNPDAILFEPATRTVWTFNGRSNDISVVSTADRKVIATIPVPGKPEFAVSDGKGNVYNNIEDKNSIIRIDANTHQITATWPIGAESPSGLAFDAEGGRLFPVCDEKKMPVIDVMTGKVLFTAAIGDGPDAAGWDSAHKLVFASSGDGILSVVDASTPAYKTIQSLKTERGARTMTYDAVNDRIYTVTAKMGPPPAPTPERPHPYPSIIPGSFEVIVIGH